MLSATAATPTSSINSQPLASPPDLAVTGTLDRGYATDVWPGLLLTGAIAAIAIVVRDIPGLGVVSPLIAAIVIGIALRNSIGTPRLAKDGVAFSLRRILRFAIMLLGFQLTMRQLEEVGLGGFAVIVASVIATFSFTTWLGRVMGVGSRLTQLIAAGTSICGASAVIATNTVTRGNDEDVAYAVACVTIFGSLAMFAYPLLSAVAGLGPHDFGLWAGASIHEIAQVVAASFQDGQASGEFGTIAKLSRVMLLAPFVITLGLIAARRQSRSLSEGSTSGGKPPVPWFLVGFIALVALNSVLTIPAAFKAAVVPATTFLLSMALAAMGLETDISKLRARGLRPLLLGAASSLFISCFSLALIKVAI